MSKLGDKHWTQAQVECLRNGYATDKALSVLAQCIGKTPRAIITKAARLGIKRPVEQLPEGYKRCPHCREIKKFSGFYKQQSWCKACLKEERRKWGEENKEHLRAYYHIRVARNPKQMKATMARASHKQRAIIKTGHDLTAEQWEQIIEKHNNICPMCGRPFMEDNPPVKDCIIPLYKSGRLTYSNVQPLHASCNRRKGKN